MTPGAARALAEQLVQQSDDMQKQVEANRKNASLLSTWADIMDTAQLVNFRDIMPADMIAAIDSPAPMPAAFQDVPAPTMPPPITVDLERFGKISGSSGGSSNG